MTPKADWAMIQQPSANGEGWDVAVLNSQQACRAVVEEWQTSRRIRANIKPGTSAPGVSQVFYSYGSAETQCTFSWRHEFSIEGHAVHTRGKHGDKEKAKAKASADVPPLRAMTNLIRDRVREEEWPTMGALCSARKQNLQAGKGTGSSADYRLGQWKTFIRSAAFVPFDLRASEAAAWKWSAWEADSDRGHCVFSCPALLRRAAEFAVLAAEGEAEGVYATMDPTYKLFGPDWALHCLGFGALHWDGRTKEQPRTTFLPVFFAVIPTEKSTNVKLVLETMSAVAAEELGLDLGILLHQLHTGGAPGSMDAARQVWPRVQLMRDVRHVMENVLDCGCGAVDQGALLHHRMFRAITWLFGLYSLASAAAE
ncbi:unnamed protein product [Symbiodinium sp. CCMP2592]|nr:unnamed protein product [Symbiodinium sp. CCMP2592]